MLRKNISLTKTDQEWSLNLLIKNLNHLENPLFIQIEIMKENIMSNSWQDQHAEMS